MHWYAPWWFWLLYLLWLLWFVFAVERLLARVERARARFHAWS